MFVRKTLHTLFGVALLGVLATSSTGATISPNRTTYFTFSKAVQLPGAVLPAGTYIFEVVNPDASANVVSVMSRDRSKLYVLRITIGTDRPRTRDMSPKIVLGERPAGNPPTVRAWFPQDETHGHQFIY